jgi:CHAT domain-containing protein
VRASGDPAKPFATAEFKRLPPLPDTAQEVREIAAILNATDQDMLLGVQASETNVKARKLDAYRVVMFATHGLVPGDFDGLTQPALALSNPDVTGEKDSDGLLTLEEVLGLKLNADWVVLSACNTASPDGAGSEAVSGLGRAFFYAGARSLLVSNWPVETVSARLLTTELFRRQAQDPALTRAEALRASMLSLMQNGGAKDGAGKLQYTYAHPMFWAPFTLIGDGSH